MIIDNLTSRQFGSRDMLLDFPDAPTLNETFPQPPILGLPVWRWDGEKWAAVNVGVGASILVAPAPPSNPSLNTLWFDTRDGRLYLWFDDGDSRQWIAVMPGEQGPVGPPASLTHASMALAAQVAPGAATPANAFVDGPAIDVGTEGTWFVNGTVVVINNSGGEAQFLIRLWDGNTILGDAFDWISGGSYARSFALSGIITDPIGPLKISVAPNTAAWLAIAGPNSTAISGRPFATRVSFINAVRIG
ncbi:MAG: hypothetical protein C5B54_04130 [Acidobacteria bacterium]|nr:MAG: hypothetical protein C5B54_04130 [Acidobacteriota bacterium]